MLLAGELRRTMYRDMVLTRCFDEQATALQRQGKLALWAPSLGQEAAQVGSAHAAGEHDWIQPSYRDHGVLQARGVALTDVLALFRGSDHGGWDAERHRVQLYTLVVGAQVLHAVGYAMGLALDGVPGAVIVYLGDGATSQGEVSEALVWAASCKAPVLFFIQNNGWAISTPTATQAAVPLARRGEGFGVGGSQVDGNDVSACYSATRAALERIHAGGGPEIIEAVTYRLGPHTTSDDPSSYRPKAEEAAWQERDPIALARAALEGDGLADEGFFAAASSAGAALAAAARERCARPETLALRQCFDHVYATDHPLVAEELADLVGAQA
ncbi:MAG: pyruvate dehydrogenase (acetyl-transferring) E1 component subunit alpha [Bifidobacteriaceae bacterium]|jgi:pyruvate dehydrogenase E1 component alpha subunit|nr:pyruvate dehydrogenase (acetyl-transferring) E1 component subunit alpha [Bifidobacteriaceae bacterium]